MSRLFYVLCSFVICYFATLLCDAYPLVCEGSDASIFNPLPCRLKDTVIEYNSESWGCIERIFLYGNGIGERTRGREGSQSISQDIIYSSDEYLSLIEEFLLGQYLSMGSDYCEIISSVYLSSDSLIAWGIDCVVDAGVVRLTLRLKDYSKTVSFIPEMPKFGAPAVLDSLAKHVVHFADEHTEKDNARK